MKLYYKPGACSMAVHIVLRESGLPFDLVQVDLATKKTAGGDDYLAVNPKGYVPALVLDDGEVLTEAPVVVQYIADRVPDKELAPANGTMPRYRMQEWLNFTTSELHKGYGQFFNPQLPEAWKPVAKGLLGRRLDVLANALKDKDYLMGKTFTVADAYLFTILNWSPRIDLDLGKWPVLKAYRDRVAERPAVRAVMLAEGLIKA